jgi:hypothetical protein
VGAVYCAQYAKGLAHLLIFVGCILGMNQGDTVSMIAAFTFAFFYVWQIIDAVRTAHALQAGLPAPDPLGLAEAFSTGGKTDTSKIPIGAVVLIGLGVLFLLQTLDIFDFSVRHVAPIGLVALGAWLFVRRVGLFGPPETTPLGLERKNFTGPVILITVGSLWLIDNVRHIGFFGWVGSLLLVIGIAKILQRDGFSGPGAPPTGPTGPISGEVQPPVSEVHNG